MRRIITALAAAGALAATAGITAVAEGGTAAVVAPAAAAQSQPYQGQLVPRTHPNGKKLYTPEQVPRTHPNGKKLLIVIPAGSSWSGVHAAGKKFNQPAGKKF